jgi:hypothetical protein
MNDDEERIRTVAKGRAMAGVEEARDRSEPLLQPLPHPPLARRHCPKTRTFSAITAPMQTAGRSGRSKTWLRSAGAAMSSRLSADQTSRRLSHVAAGPAERSTGILGPTIATSAAALPCEQDQLKPKKPAASACALHGKWSSGLGLSLPDRGAADTERSTFLAAFLTLD